MTDTPTAATVRVSVSREDGTSVEYAETFTTPYLTEAQFQRVVDGIASVVLPAIPPDGDDRPIDTTRMF